MIDREQLAARIEAATGPDRELDAEICVTLGLSEGNLLFGPDGWCFGSTTNPNPHKAPAYTASLDAAMMLVPEGQEPAVLLEAIDRCRGDNWLKALPRHIAAAAIRSQP